MTDAGPPPAQRPHCVLAGADCLPAHVGWLSPGEIAVVERFRVAKRQCDWLLGRWCAKQALAPALGLGERAFGHLEIRAADDGAPEAYLDGRHLPFCLSLSHSGSHAMAATCSTASRLGCDIEREGAVSTAVVRDFFTAGEQRGIGALDADVRPLASTLVWSTKESVLKLRRTGLKQDTRSVEVSLPRTLHAASSWQAVEARHAEGAYGSWWRAGGGYVVTVVADPPSPPPSGAWPWD